MASKCPNCGHNGAHYVPPCLGDKGFFACNDLCKECRDEIEPAPDDEEASHG